MSHLSPEGNALLTADFNEKEVFKASCQMKHNKDPILDGFPAEIYQRIWEVIITN
jgi:hypothetical protein